MATTTARLGLRKAAGTDTVNVVADIDNAMDTLDNVIGWTTCTSTTRPSAPFLGQPIRETDTGSYYVSNGTAPASGSWVPVVSTEGPTTVGAVGSAAPLRLQTTSTIAGNRLIEGRKQGDANAGFIVDFDGRHQWGPGGATATDTELSRVSAGALGIKGGAALGCFTGTATSQVATPYTGQLFLNTTDMGLYEYNGSAWIFAQSLSATGGTVQYKASALQAVATGSVDKLKFGTAVMTSTADVTVSGVGNTDFTLQRTGRWLMQANVPWGAGPNGNFSCWAWVGSATDSTSTGRHTVASGTPNNFVVYLCPGKVKRLNSGTVLSVYGFQDTGVSRNVVIDQGDLDVTFTFLGP